jgi:hypothetical protein
MAHTIKFIKGDQELTLYTTDDPAAVYRVRSNGFNIQPQPDEEQYHRPADAPPQFITAVPQNKTAVIPLDILSSTDRGAANDALSTLRTWIDGGNSDAAKAAQDPDSYTPVYLFLQLDGTTTGASHQVMIGHVNDGRAQYNLLQDTAGIYNVIVELQLAHYGIMDRIHLRNDLKNPHFVEDSNSNGAADGWDPIGGGTAAIDTDNYLLGKKSQTLTTDNSSTHYIQSDVVTATIGTDAVMSIYIAEPTGTGDPIGIFLLDGSNNTIDSIYFDPGAPAGYAATRTGAGASPITWYKYELSGTNSTAAGFRVRAIRFGASASIITKFYLDMAYLEIGEDTHPAAGYVSGTSINSQYDPDHEQIHYIDLTDIPGDQPAILDQILTFSGTGGVEHTTTAGRMSEQPGDPTTHPLFFSHADLDFTAGDGTSSTPGDGTRIGDGFLRHTSNGAGAYLNVTIPTAVFTTLGNTPLKVLVIARVSDTDAYFQALSNTNHFVTAIADPVEINSASTWSIVDAGTILLGARQFSREYMTPTTRTFQVYIDNTTSTETADVDAVMLIPATENGYITAPQVNHILGSLSFAAHNDIAGGGGSIVYYPHLGSMDTIPAGQISRLFYALSNYPNAYEHDPDRELTVDFYITPRTRHIPPEIGS